MAPQRKCLQLQYVIVSTENHGKHKHCMPGSKNIHTVYTNTISSITFDQLAPTRHASYTHSLNLIFSMNFAK